MSLDEVVEYVKFNLTGDVLELEISDESIARIIKESIKELQRYTNEFRLCECDFSNCIDLNDLKEKGIMMDYYAIANVYRTKTIATASQPNSLSQIDPLYLQFWTSFGAGMTYNLNQYLLNYASYSEMQQIRNTLSTDLYFKEDKASKKLYINVSMGNPGRVVIEYIPIYKDVEDIKDEYWLDYLKRMSLAKAKVILGRLRTYAKQSNALVSLDGDTILAEGNSELQALREELESNNDYFWPVD